MKKILIFILTAVATIVFVACSGNKNEKPNSNSKEKEIISASYFEDIETQEIVIPDEIEDLFDEVLRRNSDGDELTAFLWQYVVAYKNGVEYTPPLRVVNNIDIILDLNYYLRVGYEDLYTGFKQVSDTECIVEMKSKTGESKPVRCVKIDDTWKVDISDYIVDLLFATPKGVIPYIDKQDLREPEHFKVDSSFVIDEDESYTYYSVPEFPAGALLRLNAFTAIKYLTFKVVANKDGLSELKASTPSDRVLSNKVIIPIDNKAVEKRINYNIAFDDYKTLTTIWSSLITNVDEENSEYITEVLSADSEMTLNTLKKALGGLAIKIDKIEVLEDVTSTSIDKLSYILSQTGEMKEQENEFQPMGTMIPKDYVNPDSLVTNRARLVLLASYTTENGVKGEFTFNATVDMSGTGIFKLFDFDTKPWAEFT